DETAVGSTLPNGAEPAHVSLTASFLGFAACKVNEEPNGPVIECVKALWTFFHAEYLTISKSNTVDIHSVAMNAAAFDEQCLLCDYFTAYVTLEKQGKLPLLPTPKLLSLAGKADAGIFALFGGQARQGTNEFNFDVNPPLAILAQKLKKPIAYIPLSNAIKDMVGDKSTSENELIGDLQLEFGSLPERGEEMPLEELGSTLNSGYSGTLGKHTT
ncbi:unnamed protein product, partial [Tilletia controversa]